MLEKIFSNNATKKGLISKVDKQLIQLNIKQITQSKNGNNIQEYEKMLNIISYYCNDAKCASLPFSMSKSKVKKLGTTNVPDSNKISKLQQYHNVYKKNED